MSAATVLICGYGAFGAQHAEAWRALGRHVLVADPDAQARARAKKDGIEPSGIAPHIHDLIAHTDIVDIVSSPASHLVLSTAAVKAGKPVLLEKPAVRNAQEARELLDLQRRSGLAVQVNLLLRAHPMVAAAKTLLDQDAIGSLMVMDGRFCGWKRQHRAVGLVQNDGVHFLDLMRLFASSAITHIHARSHQFLGQDMVDDLSLQLTHANGVEGRLALGMLAPGTGTDAFVPGAQTDKVLQLVGDQGSLTLDFNAGQLRHGRVQFDADATTVHVLPGAADTQDFTDVTPLSLLQASMTAFLATVETGAPVLVPLEEGALELALLSEAIPIAAHRHARACTTVGELVS
ncbi:MAG: Gfo/Idh/MocA family protein [Devosiaceae bacterium]